MRAVPVVVPLQRQVRLARVPAGTRCPTPGTVRHMVLVLSSAIDLLTLTQRTMTLSWQVSHSSTEKASFKLLGAWRWRAPATAAATGAAEAVAEALSRGLLV